MKYEDPPRGKTAVELGAVRPPFRQASSPGGNEGRVEHVGCRIQLLQSTVAVRGMGRGENLSSRRGSPLGHSQAGRRGAPQTIGRWFAFFA